MKTKYEIDFNNIQKVYLFIQSSIINLERNKNFEEINILMPEWFKNLLYYKYRCNVSFEKISHFYGKQLLPHYKNEIVVYYGNYSVSNNGCYFVLPLDEFINTKELAAV